MSTINLQPVQGDEMVSDDGSLDFSGGQFSNNRASKLHANQFFGGENIDVDQLGQITTRRGISKLSTSPNSTLVQGLFFYSNQSQDLLIQASNKKLYQYSGSTWSSALSGYTCSSSTNLIHFTQLISNLYWVDNSGPAFRYDGTTVLTAGSWGVGTAPPSGLKNLCTHQNRLVFWGLSSDFQTLLFSDILSENTPTTNYVEVSKGDGDAIEGCLSWIASGLLVFKKRSIYVVDTTSGVGSNASITKVHDTIGCIAARTIKQIGADGLGQDVYFLAKDGVRSILTTFQAGQQGVTAPLSYPINDLIQRINWSAANTCNATYWNNRYMLAVPLDSASAPNYVLVYHTINKSWSGYWIGWNPTIFSISDFNNEPRLNFGDSSGNVMQWLDYTPTNSESVSSFQDAGSSITTIFTSKAYVFDQLLNAKLGYQLEIEFYQSSAHVNIQAAIDGQTPITLVSGYDTSSGIGFSVPFTLPLVIATSGIRRSSANLMSVGPFREIQIIITATSGKLAMKTIQLNAFLRNTKTLITP